MAPATRSQTSKTSIKKAKTPKSSTGVNQNAVKAYAEKAKCVASSLEEELGSSSDGMQKAVWALKERADRLEAELNAKNESVDGMTVVEDEPSEEDTQDEAEEGNLFVPRAASPIILADDLLEDPCDLVMTDTFGQRAADDDEKDITEYGWLRAAGVNQYYDVIGRGPPNAEKLVLIPSYHSPDQECLNDERRDSKQIRSDRQGNKLKVAIQGVAWVIPEGHQDPISLMGPRHLETK
ncbi:hypothetical protein LY76DRAFT_610599, partial [Colletotrichum caudatum]